MLANSCAPALPEGAQRQAPPAVELPLPLTEAVVAKALVELSQGAATALESCLECYRSKRMSSADLLSFARSSSIHSASLAAVFKAQDVDAQDMGEAAGADDIAELMLLLGSGPALPLPPQQQSKQQQLVAGRTSSPPLSLPRSILRSSTSMQQWRR